MRLMAPAFLLVALVSLAAALLTIGLGFYVARQRARHGIAAPATTGHPEFDRASRIHGNTVEQLAPFLVGLWLTAIYVHPLFAALVGVFWLAGRVIYAVTYAANPNSRIPGMAISVSSTIILICAALVGIVLAYFRLA